MSDRVVLSASGSYVRMPPADTGSSESAMGDMAELMRLTEKARGAFRGVLLDGRGTRSTCSPEGTYSRVRDMLVEYPQLRNAYMALLVDPLDTTRDFLAITTSAERCDVRMFVDEDEAIEWIERRETPARFNADPPEDAT